MFCEVFYSDCMLKHCFSVDSVMLQETQLEYFSSVPCTLAAEYRHSETISQTESHGNHSVPVFLNKCNWFLIPSCNHSHLSEMKPRESASVQLNPAEQYTLTLSLWFDVTVGIQDLSHWQAAPPLQFCLLMPLNLTPGINFLIMPLTLFPSPSLFLFIMVNLLSRSIPIVSPSHSLLLLHHLFVCCSKLICCIIISVQQDHFYRA